MTGAGGFIGSHLVERLVARGVSVRALLRYTAERSLGNLRDADPTVRAAIEPVWANVEDPFAVRAAVRGVDTVFHLAALVGIPYSYQAPHQYVTTNVMGTLNVLEACREAGVARVVVVSTSEAYGSAIYTPIDEQHPLQGQSPYSASKIAAEKLAQSYALSFELPARVIRPFNTFGPRQSARAVIPTIIAQALTRSEIRLGSLWPVRDFTFATDTADGMIALAAADVRAGDAFNVGSGSGVTIEDVARRVLRAIGRDLPIVADDTRVRPERSEVKELVCDATRARQELGWRPAHSLDEGLAATIEWIRAHGDRFRAGEYAV